MACVAALVACVPFAWLQPLGELVRRPEDVTLERVFRLRQMCWLMATGCGVLGSVLWVRLDYAVAIAGQWSNEVRDCSSLRGASFRDLWPVGVIVLVGAGIRLCYLNVPIAYDEAYSFLNFARRPWYEAIADYNSTNNHVLNTFLMHWAYRLFGQQEWALRLPALAAGLLLLLIAYPWAQDRLGQTTALLTTVFVATAPVLVDYSVNARGYIFVTTFAVLVDWCFERLDRRAPYPALNWSTAGLGTVLGLWAMPIMVYPLAGIVAWFLLAPLGRQRGQRLPGLLRRAGELTVFLALTGFAIAVLYSPAYVFRGLLATENPFVWPLTFPEWLAQTPGAWAGGFQRWVAGPLPAVCWAVLLLVGLLSLRRTPAAAAKILAVFGGTVLLMAVHRVAPPPRLFVFLTPWAFLVLAHGLTCILEGQMATTGTPRKANTSTYLFAWTILAGSAAYTARHPVLIDPEQRAESLLSAADVVHYLGRRTDATANEQSRLLVPLPCDLPVIYYLAKEGWNCPVNGSPQSAETLWLLAQSNREPADTLSNMVVDLADRADDLGPWQKVKSFPGLDLWRSTREKSYNR